MEKIMIVVSVSEPRTFKGNDGSDVKVVGVTLSDGINTIHAETIDKKAQALIDHPVPAGSLVNADITFSVSIVKTQDGKEFPRQNVRLNAWGVIVSPS